MLLPKFIVATVLLSALPAIAGDKDYALTVYGGYRGGGHFTDANTGETLSLESNGSASIALDIPLDAARQYQVFASYQRTNLSLDSTLLSGSNKLSMDIGYLHFGGSYFWEGEVSKGGYLVGGIGATMFNPGQGLKTELYPSINIGVGYQLPLGKTFAMRLEARGYGTLVNSHGGVFCSGGCVFSIKGDAISQGEVLLGLTTRF
jgi:hypothetical protein